jgi:chromosome partitioning protein
MQLVGQAMRVVVLASQKGGSGKTTLSGHLAVQAELAGDGPVALIDTDPQGSLAKWWNVRAQATPAFVQSVFSNLIYDIEHVREQGFKIVVIDTPPAVTRAIAEVVSFADLVILPARPSPHDLRAVGATVDIVEARRKQMIFVLNAAAPRAKITSEAAIALSQHGTVAPVTLYHRVDYAASMIDGRTVMETDPGGRSATEIKELWAYIADRLAKAEPVAPVALNPAAPILAARPIQVNALGQRTKSFGRRAMQ